MRTPSGPADDPAADQSPESGPAAPSTGAGGLRAAVERRSAGPVLFLHRLPVWVLLAVVFALLAVGMAVPGWPAAVALLALAAALGWFAFLNWPALDPGGKALRIGALAVLVGFGLGRALGRF
ncbi:DUF6703 family protein [Actinomadura hibisca]|uniref:DUF6703 family protein n=1 Tax=Actinomadura hibisca TaxID=68565 RepID=UPI00082CF46B|nr:DUF6703 family protein [Actinomadura hibisca]